MARKKRCITSRPKPFIRVVFLLAQWCARLDLIRSWSMLENVQPDAHSPIANAKKASAVSPGDGVLLKRSQASTNRRAGNVGLTTMTCALAMRRVEPLLR